MDFDAFSQSLNSLLALSKSIDPGFTGRIELLNGSYYTVSNVTSREYDPNLWENHRKYIDIHFLLEGEESIAVADASSLNIIKAYSDSDDVEMLSGSGTFFLLHPGQLLILPPGRAHQPALKSGQCKQFRKIVAKILV